MSAVAAYIPSLISGPLHALSLSFNNGYGLLMWAGMLLGSFVGFSWYFQLWHSYRDTEVEPAWKFLIPSFYAIFLGFIVGWYFLNVSQPVPLALDLTGVNKDSVCELVSKLPGPDFVCTELNKKHQLCFSGDGDMQPYLYNMEEYIPVRNLKVEVSGKNTAKMTVSVGRQFKPYEIVTHLKQFNFVADGDGFSLSPQGLQLMYYMSLMTKLTRDEFCNAVALSS